MMVRAGSLPMGLLLCCGWAMALPPNPSFEDGEDAPQGWSLSGGLGQWIDEAADGARAIAVTGDGRGRNSNHWRSATLPLEPAGVYQLRFQARRIDGKGGSPASGPVFCNRDLHDLGPSWTEYTSYFMTPGNLGADDQWLRFGQWKVDGTVAYDAIGLCPAQPLYLRSGEIELGEGERISGRSYTFTAPFGGVSANHARPLEGLGCHFNTNRLLFGRDSEAIYRFQIGETRQVAGDVTIRMNHHSVGDLRVEASRNGANWVALGAMSAMGDERFRLPGELFPAPEIQVRLSAGEGKASLQVDQFEYRATLDEAPGDLAGATRFMVETLSAPGLRVHLEELGRGMPGEASLLRAQVLGFEGEMLRPTLMVTAPGNLRISVDGTATRDTATGAWQVDLPYTQYWTGELHFALTLGKPAIYRAETTFSISSYHEILYGLRLPHHSEKVGLWWASSGWKIKPDRPVPLGQTGAITMRLARNEREAAQLVLRPETPLPELYMSTEALVLPVSETNLEEVEIPAGNIEILRVGYVDVTQPTDTLGAVGLWPDPLVPFEEPLALEAGRNHPFWVRIHAPRGIPAGTYSGTIRLWAEGFAANVPLSVQVYDFDLPDRMTCTTAFGFDAPSAFRYHNATTDGEKRRVYEKYLETLSAHHISPYNPAALDPFVTTWPDAADGDPLMPSIDWTAWDAAMERAINVHYFNSFCLPVPGMGSGSFYARQDPSLLGYGEDSPEYKKAFANHGRLVEAHLRERGWLDEAYVYWFDEPDPKDYDFVMKGFRKLEEAMPDVTRMLTEQVEPALVGGPNLWCPITPAFDLEAAEARRAEGERFWWYVCTAPKAPYATLFIDHPASELRVWLWQTWKRRIDGILIWQTNYWTSNEAYPGAPQNPYEDPMGWVTSYGAPVGTRRPWGNGDGRFIYPPLAAAGGQPDQVVLDPPVDSIRLEMLRDGIEDYEYLAILKALLEEKGAELEEKDLAKYTDFLRVPPVISASLTEFTHSPDPIERRRHDVGKAITAILAPPE